MEWDRSRMARDNRLIGIQQEKLADRVMGRKGLTAAQAFMLWYILRHAEEGTSLTAMHREFGYSKAAISSSLKNLREKGYVRMERCLEDDRRKLLFATEAGRQLEGFIETSADWICRLQKKMHRNLAAGEAGGQELPEEP